MADTFSDVMKNYSNMSVSEVGSSLLQQKDTRERQAAKADKKSNRVQQALGLLLAGQSVFKGAYNKRAKELEDAYTFELANNKTQAQEINNVSALTQPIYEWSQSEGVKDKTFLSQEEKLNSFFGSQYFDSFRVAINPYSEPTMKRLLGNDYDVLRQTSEYNNEEVESAKAYAEAWLKTDPKNKQERYKTVVSDLKELFSGEPDLDGIELFNRGIGLTHSDLNSVEKANYQTTLSQYRDKAGLIQGMKDVFSRFGKKNAQEGGLNLFKRVDTDTLAGPSIERMLNSLDLKGLSHQIANKAVANMGRSTTRWGDQLYLPKNKSLLDQMALHFESLDSKIGGRILPDDYGTFKNRAQIIGRGLSDDLMDNITDAEKKALFADGGALSLALDPRSGDQKLIAAIFRANHKGRKGDPIVDLDTFKQRLSDRSFRGEYGLVLAMSDGVAQKGVFGNDTRYQPKGNVPNLVYDRYLGRVPFLMGEGIIRPTKTNPKYTTDDNWEKFTPAIKKEAYLTEVLSIQKENTSEISREKKLNSLYNSVSNPFNYTLQELLESSELMNFAQQNLQQEQKEIYKNIPRRYR